MTHRPPLIYALLDPETFEVRYIGKTVNPKNRARQHLMAATGGTHTPVYCWWRSLIAANRPHPVMAVIASSTSEEWEALEVEVIAQYRQEGARLLNVADGGNAPHITTEQRAATGRKIARLVHDNPERKRIWRLKKEIGMYLRKLQKEGRIGRLIEYKARLKVAATRCPSIYGAWA